MANHPASNEPKWRPSPPDPRAGGLFGWPPWTLGVALGLSALIGFVLIARAAANGGPPTTLDQVVADWFRGHRAEGLRTGMLLATGLGSTAWVSGSVLVIAIGLSWKRAWDRLFVFGLIVPGGMAVNVFLKQAFHRPRPLADNALPILTSASFPSGHTLAATLLYGGLVFLAWSELNPWRGRMGAVLGAIILVTLVGLSRVQLGAHHLSDVLGAVAFGIAWLMFCLTATGRGRPRGNHD